MVEDIVYIAAASITGLFSIGSAMHALLVKRDPRSALGWLVLCIMLPFVGASAYWLLGNNRIRTRARKWQELGLFALAREVAFYEQAGAQLQNEHPVMAENLQALLQISRRVTGRPLLLGNKVEPLYNGETAYPAMLEAIEGAEHYIYLCTYLFDTDDAGRRFVDALVRAGARGVDVRVLVDAIGERYARPRVSKLLRGAPGVKVSRFLPLGISMRGLRVNLRNHRKILVADGQVGFTGGMNIGQRHMVEDAANKFPTADIQFRITGPAVYALEEVFLEDWFFTTGEQEAPEHGPIVQTGRALCRGIKDGPNEDFEKLQWILVGALTCARRSVKILTPYFIPSREILAALLAAALRGIRVEIVLPQRSNLPFVDWATRAMLWEILQYGVRVFVQPLPFDHSKVLLVDDFYVNLGSANIDPRSLRLNFEFNLEVFDSELARPLADHFQRVRGRSTELTAEALDARSLPVKLRDAAAKLFAPYL